MNKQRLKHILIGLVLLLGIWIAWPEAKPSNDPKSAENTESTGKRFNWRLLDFGQNKEQGRTLNRTKSTSESAMGRIGRLIDHKTLTDHEVAEQLLIIAKDKQVPENARAEALGHGVILDLPVFVGMAADTQLPAEMAANLIHHVINANQDRALQIRAYVDFLNHSSPEIREEAKRMLAFVLEDDLGKADEATLIQMADARLKKIEAEAEKSPTGQ